MSKRKVTVVLEEDVYHALRSIYRSFANWSRVFARREIAINELLLAVEKAIRVLSDEAIRSREIIIHALAITHDEDTEERRLLRELAKDALKTATNLQEAAMLLDRAFAALNDPDGNVYIVRGEDFLGKEKPWGKQ
jgi:hypothetical protein